jgi:hypothetical protein
MDFSEGGIRVRIRWVELSYFRFRRQPYHDRTGNNNSRHLPQELSTTLQSCVKLLFCNVMEYDKSSAFEDLRQMWISAVIILYVISLEKIPHEQ